MQFAHNEYFQLFVQRKQIRMTISILMSIDKIHLFTLFSFARHLSPTFIIYRTHSYLTALIMQMIQSQFI